MAINALDFDAGTHFRLQSGIAVGVLHEVAVGAVHALLEVNVHEMDGHSLGFVHFGIVVARLGMFLQDCLNLFRRFHRRGELFGRHVRDLVACVVE